MLTRTDAHVPLLNSAAGRAAVELLGRICLKTAVDSRAGQEDENPLESVKAEAVLIVENDVLPDLLSAVRRAADTRF